MIKEEKGSSAGSILTESPGLGNKSVPKGKKEVKGRVSLSLEKADLSQMVEQIKEEVDNHQRAAAEIEKKMEKLATAALDELLKVRELKGIIESLRKRGPLAGEKQGVSEDEDTASAWKVVLDQNLERLLAIKKLLERSLRPKKEKKEAVPAPQPISTARKKILVVDDDPTTVKIIVHFLEREKFVVRTSLSGSEGLKKAFEENPDLILLDIMMPDLNGFQFLSVFQKDEQRARIPVIILSSLTEEADILRGLQTGAVDYITKPFSPPVLLAKIRKNLDSHP